MGSLCIFPLSSMESAFHFICGITGPEVCFNCFACVALIHFCVHVLWVWCLFRSLGEKLGPASGTSLLSVHIFLEVVGYVVKVCGHLIFRNLTYPIVFTCVLPSMIDPIMLVTSKMVGNALLLICRCKIHEPSLNTD